MQTHNARQLRAQTPMPRHWIAQRLGMGSASYVSNLLTSVDSKLLPQPRQPRLFDSSTVVGSTAKIFKSNLTMKIRILQTRKNESMNTLTRLSLAATIIAAVALNTVPAYADPKSTPRPTATPFVIKEKEGKFDLEKEKITALQKRNSTGIQPPKVDKTSSQASTVAASPKLQPINVGTTTTRGIAEDKNWGDKQTMEGKKSDRLQKTIETQKKPTTNNVRAQSARAEALKTQIQTLHQQISDIYRKRHDVIYDKSKPQNERNQESKDLLGRAKALEERVNKAADSYNQILSSTSILN